MQGPSFGFGVSPGGRVRVRFGGGDFSPNSLWKAVISGRGYHKPRLFGLSLFGLGVVFLVVNLALIYLVNFGYPYFVALVPPFCLGGLWLLVTGQPAATPDESPAPMWGRLGLGALLALGLVGGIIFVWFVWMD
jgi:hypothetical protein